MTQTVFNFKIQTSNNGVLDLPINNGQAIFVLGANGVGKSTLMQAIFRQNVNNSKRILAHRQTWFPNNTIDITASQKRQNEGYMRNSDQAVESRWKDDYPGVRSTMTIFDIIDSENVRARHIAKAVDGNNLSLAQSLANEQAPIKAINELLAVSNIPIIITLEKDEQLFASKNGSTPYSIAELSDGERNALLICADVLTAQPSTLIILDEPERHLHRSIISPLLSSLFQKRKDCAFVISTHDITLPIDHVSSSTLLIRGCDCTNKHQVIWDADFLAASNVIPDEIKKDILGSKRDLLFVEGKVESLDKQVYQLIYPTVSVIPLGSCTQDQCLWINRCR
jgi:ABC-type cobalamin/Fe3+-siderophores transport system ATPase subunit